MKRDQIKTLMEQYGECEKIVALDLGGHDPKTLPGMQMRQRECKDQIADLKRRYESEVLSRAFTIFLHGPLALQQAYLESAKKTTKVLTADARALYEFLAKDIEPSLGDRRIFGTSQLAMLCRGLTEAGRQIEFTSRLQTPNLPDLRHCPSTNDVIEYARELVRASSTDTLNQKWIEASVIKQALEIRYTRAVAPVIVTGATEAEAHSLGSSLFSKKTFTVNVNEENSAPDGVLAYFKDIYTKVADLKQ